MIGRVISGFQSGADIAGIRAAKAAGIATGGWLPKGYLTEDGPRPEYLELYGAKEYPGGTTVASRYRVRAIANVKDSDATLCFFNGQHALSTSTLNAQADCKQFNRLFRPVGIQFGSQRETVSPRDTPAVTAAWLVDNRVCVLNVAGSRESKRVGIQAAVERYLAEVFRIMQGETS